MVRTWTTRSSVRTIDRMVEVLDCFSKDRPAWSLSELSARLDLPKSTLHRFLVGLERNGLLRRGTRTTRWRLGHRLFIWGSLAAGSTGVRQVALPVLRDLAETTGETVLLTEYHDGEVICIDKIETSHSVRIALEVGARRAPHAGASSKVLMAYLPDSRDRRNHTARRVCRATASGPSRDPADLHRELERIRQCGYALSYEETDRGAWGIATPIRNWDGGVVAAVGVAGPTVRFSSELAQRYVSLCCDAAARVSTRLAVRKSCPRRHRPREEAP